MKISVVTPSFNQGRFIEETIRSVISQTGDFSIDYIIMDGGSTDESAGIIQKYDGMLKGGSLVPRCKGITFRWSSARDNGQVDALKKGFDLAEGDILCWLNSDDVFLGDGVLQTVTSRFSSDHDLGLLTGDGLFIDEAGKELGVHHVDEIRVLELLFLDYHILQPASFFRKEVYHKQLLKERYVCAFDADFFIGLIISGIRYRKIDDRLAGFRIYPGIKTKKFAALRYREQMHIAWEYSGNIFYFFVAAVYRYVEIILRMKYEQYGFFHGVFRKVYKISYRLVLGRNSRRLFRTNA
ncbi:MAG: glycosyltransferase [Thermodesulfovibrionales bacterium]